PQVTTPLVTTPQHSPPSTSDSLPTEAWPPPPPEGITTPLSPATPPDSPDSQHSPDSPDCPDSADYLNSQGTPSNSLHSQPLTPTRGESNNLRKLNLTQCLKSSDQAGPASHKNSGTRTSKASP